MSAAGSKSGADAAAAATCDAAAARLDIDGGSIAGVVVTPLGVGDTATLLDVAAAIDEGAPLPKAASEGKIC